MGFPGISGSAGPCRARALLVHHGDVTMTLSARARGPLRSVRSLDATARVALLAAMVFTVLAFASNGFLWQDEYAHLLFSKGVWSHPEVAADLWGRPLATLVYAVPALAGLWAARLVTIALAVLAVLWTGRAAHRRGLSGPVTAAAMLAQPIFSSFAFGALPGTLFAALLARLLLEDARGRHRSAAIVAALLPLARVEGVLIVVVYALTLWRRGERRLAAVPFAGLAAWNLAGWAVTGELLFLLTANPYPAVGSIYPTAGFAYLGRIMPVAAGVGVFVLAQAGLVARARRPELHHAFGAITAVFLILVWGVPLFASTPTPVYLIGFAPLLALYAAEGWAWLREHRARLKPFAMLLLAEAFVLVPHRTLGAGVRHLAAPVAGTERIVLAAGFALIAGAMLVAARRPRALAAGLIVAAALHVGVVVAPVRATTHERLAAEAAAWYRAEASGRLMVAVAPDVAWFAGLDPFTDWEPGSLPADPSGLHRLPAGTLLAWDSVFSPREGRTSLTALHDGGWVEIIAFTGDGTEIRILERR